MSDRMIFAQQFSLDTNDFVEKFKSLSSTTEAADDYRNTMENLILQLQEVTSNDLIDHKPLALAVIDHLYRVIPVFEQKLLSEDSFLTNRFLQNLSELLRGGLSMLNLFLSIKESSHLETIFRNYLPHLKDTFFRDETNYDNLVNCFLPVIAYSNLLISIDADQLSTKMFIFLLDFTKKHWNSKSRETIIKNILSLMKVCGRIPSLVEMILQTDWPKYCIHWLKAEHGSRPSFEVDYLIFLVLQKLARHTDGVSVLNQLNCCEILQESDKQMQIDHTAEEYQTIRLVKSVICTLLLESDELKEKSFSNDQLLSEILQQLIAFITHASQTESLAYRGCHISEILCVLSKLFVNDHILWKCLEENHRFFDYLCQLLVSFSMINSETLKVYQILNDGALTSLANLLWSISFHQRYHEKFKSNAILMHTLSNLATSSSLYTSTPMKSIPKDVFPLKQAAEGILWNIKSIHSLRKTRLSEEKTSVMISYCHSDAQFCHELVDHLSEHLSVWVDYKYVRQHSSMHSDDLWEDIARAMEIASTVILILSADYYDSKSCRQEVSYASDTLKKRILPIYAPSQQYRASGWLGIRIAGQKYVHFGRKRFSDAFNELLSLIIPDEPSTSSPCRKSSIVTVPVKQEEKSLNNWTVEDIGRWFDDNHIHPDLKILFAEQFHTGTALMAYAHHFKQCYRQEYLQVYTNYHRLFKEKYLQTIDFITFVDALWRLREKYDPQSKNEDIWERHTNRQHPCVMKALGDTTMIWL